MGEARILLVRALVPTIAVCVAAAACAPQTEGTARGIVVEVEGTLDEVTAFTMLIEGSRIRYLPVEDGDYDFPLPHLRDHQRSGEPVLIGWERVGDTYYALSVADG